MSREGYSAIQSDPTTHHFALKCLELLAEDSCLALEGLCNLSLLHQRTLLRGALKSKFLIVVPLLLYIPCKEGGRAQASV